MLCAKIQIKTREKLIMESKTLQFLKKCSSLSGIEGNSALKLHYRTLLIKHKSTTGKELHTQNEHFKGKQAKPAPVKNAVVECKFCFTKAIPEFKVKRHRPKNQKKLKKTLVFECKICHKVIFKKEDLPTLETLKPQSTNQKSVEAVNMIKEETRKEVLKSGKPKKKRKKDHNAGLIIPLSLQKKSSNFGGSDKLKNLLSNESNESGKQSRLQMMLK